MASIGIVCPRPVVTKAIVSPARAALSGRTMEKSATRTANAPTESKNMAGAKGATVTWKRFEAPLAEVTTTSCVPAGASNGTWPTM